MALSFVDRYSSTLASSYTSGGTSISVVSASGLPSGACTFYMIVRAELTNTEEVFLVSNVSGTTLTVTGAQAGTSASNHSSGASIIGSIMTVAAFNQMRTDMNQVGTFASLPSSGMVKGDTYRTTDSMYEFVYTGSAWQAFWHGIAVTLPSSITWSGLNLGSSANDTTYGYGYLAAVPGTNYQVRFQYQTAPATPYTRTYIITHDISGFIAKTAMNLEAEVLIGFTDGTKLVVMQNGWTNAGSGWIVGQVVYWSTASANPPSVLYAPGTTTPAAVPVIRPLYLRLKDDGTNIIFYLSLDLQHWNQIYSESRTSHFTSGPTGMGWGVYLYGGAGATGATVSTNLISVQ